MLEPVEAVSLLWSLLLVLVLVLLLLLQADVQQGKDRASGLAGNLPTRLLP